MFKQKCPHCGAKNDNERITCMECGKPFDVQKTEEEFTVAPAEQLEQVGEEEEDEQEEEEEKEEEEEQEEGEEELKNGPDTFQNQT